LITARKCSRFNRSPGREKRFSSCPRACIIVPPMTPRDPPGMNCDRSDWPAFTFHLRVSCDD
jgi:hypothetical protein